MRPEGRILILGFNPKTCSASQRLWSSRDVPWSDNLFRWFA